MLLILGQPGIGKSTLITWITANFTSRIDDILVYKFASDLGKINWKENRVSNRILEELGLEYSDLNGKTLILDGFDEVSAEENRRRDVLDCLYGDWIYDKVIKDFSLIITCRENYIKGFERVKSNYIVLQPWNEIQIKSFFNVFQERTKNKISESTIEKTIENKDVFGIPLILYMVLALNISIEKEASIVDVYDKIFSLEGGIYDRCIDNKKFASSHRIGEVKKQIHQISRDIAMWMFENEPDEARIPQEEYQKICINVMYESEQGNYDITQDFKIGGFFKLVHHCEGIETEELYFVHRTIFEYFVAEAVFVSMYGAIDTSKERLAYIFGKILKKGRLSPNILEYLKYKIMGSKLNNEFNIVNEAFQLMLQDGMTYYTGECYKNMLQCEICIFTNMINVFHLWEDNYLECNESIRGYINCSMGLSLSLRGVDFWGLDLRNIDLRNINLKFVNLNKANLKNAKIDGANLSFSSLKEVCLINASLVGGNLMESDLRLSKISNADMKNINLSGSDLRSADLSKSNLSRSWLNAVKLGAADLRMVNLSDAEIRGADLEWADLRKANLKGVDFTGTNLVGANLRGADLLAANLEGSIWCKVGISSIFPQLKQAHFTYILIENDSERRRIHRNKLFLNG